jgi:hypothetical protein
VEPTITENKSTLKGVVESPSRQVLTSVLTHVKHIDKQNLLENFIEATEPMYSVTHQQKQQGRRARNRQKRNKDTPHCPQTPPALAENVWTIQDATFEPGDLGSLQPEIEINSDTSFYTRTTDPHNPRRVAEILKNVSIGADLSDKQCNEVRSLLAKFADCFALSVREVLPIPGAEHLMHIPPDATFPKKIPHQ